ncbi:transposase, partial [Bacillus cereus]|nr:transposase [Bacillus cereus]
NMSWSERVYSGICGVNLDRDDNAAITIKQEAIRLLALA